MDPRLLSQLIQPARSPQAPPGTGSSNHPSPALRPVVSLWPSAALDSYQYPVCQPCLPETAEAAWHDSEHAPQWNCWDNAPVERFLSSLKREWTGDRLYRTRQEAIADVREYVAVYYNARRLHSTLGYKTPMNYEKDLN
jgi:hypothetical protein